MTFAELHRRAAAIARELEARWLAGRPVLVACPAGLDYVVALVGTLYAGAIAVPAYPPTRGSLARVLPRLRTIAADAGSDTLITTSAVRSLWNDEGAGEFGSCRCWSSTRRGHIRIRNRRSTPQRPRSCNTRPARPRRPRAYCSACQVVANQQMVRLGGHTGVRRRAVVVAAVSRHGPDGGDLCFRCSSGFAAC